MRSPAVIRNEIDVLAERRACLWRQGAGGARSVRPEVLTLTRRIDELWLEFRTIRATLKVGSREQVLARAKRAMRAEQELRRRIPIS